MVAEGYGTDHGIDHGVEIELGCPAFHDCCHCGTIPYDLLILYMMEDGMEHHFEGAD